jgi:hypothetical protein
VCVQQAVCDCVTRSQQLLCQSHLGAAALQVLQVMVLLVAVWVV